MVLHLIRHWTLLSQRLVSSRLVCYTCSHIVVQVKPWDDETDMAEMEKAVRTIEMDGLVWGQAKLIPVGYGIKKLQINCVVEDDKVGTDDLEEKITAFEDFVSFFFTALIVSLLDLSALDIVLIL